MRHALILVEARGQAIHLREDAQINLVQAAWMAARYLDQGVHAHVWLILDGGQSPEEYSLLCHLEDDVVAGYRRRIAAAAEADRARREVVSQVRERQMVVGLRAQSAFGPDRVDDALFFAPVLAEVSDVNAGAVHASLRSRHPWIDHRRQEEYEALLTAHVGRPYLELEEACARLVLREVLGARIDEVLISTTRPANGPATWFGDVARDVVAADLLAKEQGQGGGDLGDRLIGVFTGVALHSGGVYFNSPTSARREHRRVRITPRDRFGILGLAGSERMRYDELRGLLESQRAAARGRLLGLKYPYLAEVTARSAANEAERLSRDGAVEVAFVEGSESTVNARTAGLLDVRLRALLPRAARYRRVLARDEVRRALPNLPGGSPLVAGALARLLPESVSVVKGDR